MPYKARMISRVAFKRASIATANSYIAIGGCRRNYVSQTRTKRSTIAVDPGHTSEQQPSQPSVPVPPADQYLKTLSKKELLSLGVIGFVTINRTLLNFVIKLFPFVPSSVVRLFISSLYCGGSTMHEVRETGKALRNRGVNNMMLSLTIEDAEGTKNIDIDYIVSETIRSLHEVLKPNLEEQLQNCEDINSIPPGYLALKPSALVANPSQVLLNFGKPGWATQRQNLIDNCTKITEQVFKLNQEFALKYPERRIPFFVSTIDAEKYNLQKAGVYELQRILFSKFNPVTSPMVSCVGTWQCYLRDSGSDLLKEVALAKQEGYKIGVKLVRGAYLHSEPDRKVIFPTKEGTDKNYDELLVRIIHDLLNNGEKSTFGHLVVASHNYESQLLVNTLLKSSGPSIGKANVVLGHLLGMAENVTHEFVNGYGVKNIIKYTPWGPPKETKDYILRRLQENGDAVRSENGWPLVKAVFRTLLRI